MIVPVPEIPESELGAHPCSADWEEGIGTAVSFTDNQQGNNDFVASVLRCNYAEACRQRDCVPLSTGWRGWAVAKSAYFLRQLFRITAWAMDSAVGSVRTIRSLAQMDRLCDRADVVSFDVFDTLLYRTVEPPEQLKRLVANFAAERYSARGYPVTAELILYLRNESEWRQRRVAHSAGSDMECKLFEIIHQ